MQTVFNGPRLLQPMLYDDVPHLRVVEILANRRVNVMAIIKLTGDTFVWVSMSLDADDGETVVKPNVLSNSEPGRWVRLLIAGGGGTGDANGYFPQGWR